MKSFCCDFALGFFSTILSCTQKCKDSSCSHSSPPSFSPCFVAVLLYHKGCQFTYKKLICKWTERETVNKCQQPPPLLSGRLHPSRNGTHFGSLLSHSVSLDITTPLSVEPDCSDCTDEWSSVSDWLLIKPPMTSTSSARERIASLESNYQLSPHSTE